VMSSLWTKRLKYQEPLPIHWGFLPVLLGGVFILWLSRGVEWPGVWFAVLGLGGMLLDRDPEMAMRLLGANVLPLPFLPIIPLIPTGPDALLHYTTWEALSVAALSLAMANVVNRPWIAGMLCGAVGAVAICGLGLGSGRWLVAGGMLYASSRALFLCDAYYRARCKGC
jgi:hypothetical protein